MDESGGEGVEGGGRVQRDTCVLVEKWPGAGNSPSLPSHAVVGSHRGWLSGVGGGSGACKSVAGVPLRLKLPLLPRACVCAYGRSGPPVSFLIGCIV